MEVRLAIKVTPNASRERIIYDEQGTIKIYVMAPAIEGKANAAVIALCAKKIGVSKRSITILDGEKGRYKILLFETPYTKAELLQLLGLEVQSSFL